MINGGNFRLVSSKKPQCQAGDIRSPRGLGSPNLTQVLGQTREVGYRRFGSEILVLVRSS